MSNPTSIKSLIDLWPSRRALADDVTAPHDPVLTDRVHGWAKSGSIPARYHRRILDAAARRGFCVDADLLADLHDPRIGREDAA